MKKMHAVAILMIALMASTAAFAQSNVARVQIPFEFRAGDQVLPAGEYQVNAVLAGHRIELRQLDGSAAALLMATLGFAAEAPEQGTLLFHKYGKTVFLRSFEAAGRTDRYVLPKSGAEREMARRNASLEIASVEIR